MTSGSLTALEDAVAIVLAEVDRLDAEQVELLAAEGRVLAEDVTSPESAPAADNSAMDGFALVAADTEGATDAAPVRLSLAGESRAGAPFDGALPAGAAATISTGAVIPEGADAVLRVEDAREEDGERAGLRAGAGGQQHPPGRRGLPRRRRGAPGGGRDRPRRARGARFGRHAPAGGGPPAACGGALHRR